MIFMVVQTFLSDMCMELINTRLPKAMAVLIVKAWLHRKYPA